MSTSRPDNRKARRVEKVQFIVNQKNRDPMLGVGCWVMGVRCWCIVIKLNAKICGRKFALTYSHFVNANIDVFLKTTALIQGTGLLYLCADDSLKHGLIYLLGTQLLSMYGKCKGGRETLPPL